MQVHVFPNSYSTLGDVWLTVYDARATKDRGIQLLAKYGGFSLGELTVFGDGNNDGEMFEMAPHAVAVGEAVPAVVELATEHIGHAAEDSVVKYLQRAQGHRARVTGQFDRPAGGGDSRLFQVGQ